MTRTGGTRSSIQRELARLMEAGVLEREAIGRTSLYRPADSPLRDPLSTLIERTLGVAPRLSERLGAIDGIEAAAIYGSWAAENVGPSSDIDVVVIGEAVYDDVFTAVAGVERTTGREVHLKLYRPGEFREKLAEGSGFLRTILRRPLVPLVGSLPEEPD
jgi:predicted nucleotidyltransferase